MRFGEQQSFIPVLLVIPALNEFDLFPKTYAVISDGLLIVLIVVTGLILSVFLVFKIADAWKKFKFKRGGQHDLRREFRVVEYAVFFVIVLNVSLFAFMKVVTG